MTRLVLGFVVVTALAACGGKKAPATSPGSGSDTAVASPDQGGGITCDKEIARVCENGVDGCASGKTLVHACIAADATDGPPCTQEIAKVCPTGQTDACLKTPAAATTHICVF